MLVSAQYAQSKSDKLNIVASEELKESNKKYPSDVVASDEGGIYVIKKYKQTISFGTSIILQHFDKNMNPVLSAEIEPEYQGKDTWIEFFADIEEVLYIFYSFENKKTKKKCLYSQSINKKTLTLNDDQLKIVELTPMGKNIDEAGEFYIKKSNDKSKVMIFYDHLYDEGEFKKFGFLVFDSKLNKLWDKRVVTTHAILEFLRQDMVLSNDGSVFVLAMLYNDRDQKGIKEMPTYRYVVLSYFNGTKDDQEYPMGFEDYFIDDPKIGYKSEKKSIYVGGLYSHNYTGNINGSYCTIINTGSDQINSNEQEFDKNFIDSYMSEKELKDAKRRVSKGGDVELYKYTLDEMIINDDGSAVLIGEYNYEVGITTKQSDGSSRKIYRHYSNSIIAIGISPSGEIGWNAKIPKRQFSSDDQGVYNSYSRMIFEDKIYFIFNDRASNISYENDIERIYLGRKEPTFTMLVCLDRNGKHTKEALLSIEDSKFLLYPDICRQISDVELIIFSDKKTRLQKFSKLSFK